MPCILAAVAENEGSVVYNCSAFSVVREIGVGGKIVVLRRVQLSSVWCYRVCVVSVVFWMQLVYSVGGWGVKPMPTAWGGFGPVAKRLAK
jgi:hypothetical protein